MKTTTDTHWGGWVQARSRHVGYRRQQSLAAAVGCRAEQLCRWVQLPQPPARMLKDFDALLARALKTDRATLFAGFRTITPDMAPVVEGGPVDADGPRRRAAALAELLPAEQLREWTRIGEGMLHNREPATAA